MPRPIQPPTLRDASLMSIARNINYWSAGQSPSQTDFISPFQDLQDDMIEELIGKLDQIHIGVLFHPSIRRLKIECVSDPSCIQLMITRCQKLTDLSLECTSVQPAVLCEIVSSLTELVSLNLNSTDTDRSVLKAIVDNCPKLHDLRVQDCRRLKNSDFLLLCNEPKSPRIRLQLTNLKLSNSFIHRISVNTVVSLLNSHPNLKSLGECELIGQALCHMYGTGYQHKKEVPQTWIHNLSEVTLYGRKEDILDLKITTLCCPHLTALSLHHMYGPIHSLKAASNLKSLKSLSIFGVSFRNTFQADVVPILEKIGGNLISLGLLDMDEVCVFLIGEFCPNLQSLLLRGEFRSSTYNPTTGQYFKKLQVFYIKDTSMGKPTFPTEALSGILEDATEINDINFSHVNNLTDSIILKANTKHGFRFLRKARIDACHFVTKDSLFILLNQNPLLQLSQIGKPW